MAPLLILGLTFLAYLPVLRGGFIWDDDDYVTENPTLRSTAGLVDIWTSPRSSPQYYPMVFTTFWVEHQLWGDRAAGYHLVNILLHAAASLLLWRVLTVLDIPGALLAACLFAVHPVHVESVAWISERKNVLSAVFYFASALAYLAWAARPSASAAKALSRDERSGGTPKPLKRGTGFYAVSLGLFILALLSKTVTCSLPAAMLLVVWWKRGRLTRRDVFPLMPFFAIGLALAINTAYLEVSHVSAAGGEWALSPVDRLLIAGRAIWFYATKLVLPLGLSFIYPRWTIDPAQAWQWAFPAGLIVALAALWVMRDRWGRGPLVATLIFAGTLVPALGFFNIYPMRYTFAADHYQYHASAAMIALAAAGLSKFHRGGAVLLVPLIVLCFLRAAVFRDAEVLWRDTLAKNPDSWMAHNNLAKTLAARDRNAEALPHFRRQVELAPALPESYWNYGSSLFLEGRYDEALRAYDEAIRLAEKLPLDGNNPAPQAHFRRGRVLMEQHQFAAAAGAFQRAVELKGAFGSDYPEARDGYARAMRALAGQSPPRALPPPPP